MKLSEAIEGFALSWRASGKSDNTIRLYKYNLRNLVNYLEDPKVENITLEQLQRFMVYLRTEHVPNRPNGDTSPYSEAAIDNHWKAIRSLFRWCHEQHGLARPDMGLPHPNYKLSEVSAFSEEDVRALLKCADGLRKVGSPFNNRESKRTRALILLLLDTGLRVSEVCRLEIGDIDLEKGKVHVDPCGSGQKTKPRTVYISKATRRALWLYIACREDPNPGDNLFQLCTQGVRNSLKRLGKLAGVENVHPHRFRHTFAIWYLRNSGDVFTLQRLLGLAQLTMVEHYLDIVSQDVEAAHRRASPVDRFSL